MSRLRIFDDQNGALPLAEHEDPAAIAAALETFTPDECANYFANSGYDPY